MSGVIDLLLQRAKWAHPVNAANRRKWVAAAQYLRQRQIWILDARVTRKTGA